jgi:hypothetical protein
MRDVLFEDNKFPYGAALTMPQSAVLVELPWPSCQVPATSPV